MSETYRQPYITHPITCGQGPDSYIAALRGLIDAGIRVPESTRLLRDILAHASENPDLNQDIPDELPTPEELRVKQLLENTIEYDEKDRANYTAVLNDYQQGVIKHPKQGFGYFYYAGNRVTDEIELAKFPLHDHFDEWIQAHGGEGKSWFEEGYKEMAMMMAMMMAASTSIGPSNLEAHHMV